MERMLALMIESPVATGAGAIGMLCLAVYPMFRARSLLLVTYLGNSVGFAVHYALLGQATAMTMNIMAGAQTLVAIWLERWSGLRWVSYAFMPLLLWATAMTWHGRASLLSAAASALSALGRMQRNETALRVLWLASAPVWAAHSCGGIAPGLVADVACIAIGAWMLLQHLRATGRS